MYSSIKRKKCKCGNPKCYPTLGFGGFNAKCASQEIKENAGSKYDLARKKKNARLAVRKSYKNEDFEKKVLWYKSRRYEMTGVCHEPNCGNKTNKDSDKYYTWSVCHIVPKSLVPSVAYHVQNWVELCWQHHYEFDSNFDTAKEMGIFKEAKRKFNQFKHLIPNEELRKVNPHLLNEK